MDDKERNQKQIYDAPVGLLSYCVLQSSIIEDKIHLIYIFYSAKNTDLYKLIHVMRVPCLPPSPPPFFFVLYFVICN